MALRAIVFDFDGVLANSEPLHLRTYQAVLAEEGLSLGERDYYARYLGFDDVGAFQAMARDNGRSWSAEHIDDLIARKARYLEELERERSVLYPGAAEIVRRTAAALPIAIASGALGAEIRRVLDREGLTTCFTAIVGAGDTPKSKPAPDPYLKAVALVGAHAPHRVQPHECVAVEDSVWGLESARQAGLRTVAVAHTYPADSLTADLVLESLAALDLESLKALCAI